MLRRKVILPITLVATIFAGGSTANCGGAGDDSDQTQSQETTSDAEGNVNDDRISCELTKEETTDGIVLSLQVEVRVADATRVEAEFDFGDGHTESTNRFDKVDEHVERATYIVQSGPHRYEGAGDYTVSAHVTFKIGGSSVTVDCHGDSVVG